MKPQKRLLERQLIKFWSKMNTTGREDICEGLGIQYGQYLAMLQFQYEREQGLPAAEQRKQRLLKVRASVKSPRLGKTSKIFILRHFIEAKALQNDGATYKEISVYLQHYRRFKISISYLKRLMESMK